MGEKQIEVKIDISCLAKKLGKSREETAILLADELMKIIFPPEWYERRSYEPMDKDRR